MRKGTKHDLSFNKVTLDMAATEECVRIAYGSLINKIRVDSEELLESLHCDGPTLASSCFTARNLSSAAESLVDVAETLYTIRGMSTRDSIVLANKRENIRELIKEGK